MCSGDGLDQYYCCFGMSGFCLLASEQLAGICKLFQNILGACASLTVQHLLVTTAEPASSQLTSAFIHFLYRFLLL